MSKFQSYGTITSKFPSSATSSSLATSASTPATSSNWICIQYESTLEADKAFCQHGTLQFGGRGGNGTFYRGGDSDSTHPSVISVLRMDETLAHNLGLKGFLELGSTGVERLGWNKVHGIEKDTNTHSEMDVDSPAETGTNIRQAAAAMDESDVLLTEGEYGRPRRRRDGRGDMMRASPMQDLSQEDIERRENLCEKVLAWFFEWDDTRDATFMS